MRKSVTPKGKPKSEQAVLSELREKAAVVNAMEDELKESNERFKQLIDNLPGLFYQINANGQFTRWNKNFEKVSQYSDKELAKMSPLDLMEGHDKKQVEAKLRTAFETGQATTEAMLVSKKGEKTPYFFTGNRIMVNDQPFLTGMGLDISDQTLAKEKLRESEEKFRLAFDNAAIGKALVNMEGRFIKVNPGICQMFGYDETEFLTKTWMELTHPEVLQTAIEMVEKLVKNEQLSSCFDLKTIRKNGTTLWINLNIVMARDHAGNPLFLIGDMVDITDRKLFAEELNFRNQIVRKFLTVSDDEMFHEVLKIILDAMGSPYGVFGYLDENGALVVPSMTRSIWKECNVPEKDIVFPRETWGESSWPRAIREKRPNFTNEPSSITPTGHIRITRHISLPIVHKGIVIGLLQVANKETDYTSQDVGLLETLANSIAPILAARMERNREERRRSLAEKALEEKVIELERSNKELEQFAYVASHDLQEPLRMVSSYTQLLERRYKDLLDDDAHDFIRFAVDGANRMQRLINDLLDFSRVTTRGNPFKKVDLSLILGQAIANLQQKISDSQALIVNDELPFVNGDESQLIRLFQNLIENAIKFRSENPPRVTITAVTEDNSVTVSIKDNGIGIDEVYADRIFNIFQRLHTTKDYPGTGIGLAICKRIVERHGGTIGFTSEEGKGSTFWFTLKR